jgi:hypothetical protein
LFRYAEWLSAFITLAVSLAGSLFAVYSSEWSATTVPPDFFST